jgi:hypothetical protein
MMKNINLTFDKALLRGVSLEMDLRRKERVQ